MCRQGTEKDFKKRLFLWARGGGGRVVLILVHSSALAIPLLLGITQSNSDPGKGENSAIFNLLHMLHTSQDGRDDNYLLLVGVIPGTQKARGAQVHQGSTKTSTSSWRNHGLSCLFRSS